MKRVPAPHLCAVLLLGMLSSATLAAAAQDMEIDYLLDAIRTSGCQFVRNGESHDATAAAEHLAMKYRRARRHVADADQFIERIASASSWSGKPYYVACSVTGEVLSATWLSHALQRYRQDTQRVLSNAG